MIKKNIDWRIVCTGLVCLTVLEVYALSIGYNGTLLKIALIVIAGVIGISIPFQLTTMKGGADNGK